MNRISSDRVVVWSVSALVSACWLGFDHHKMVLVAIDVLGSGPGFDESGPMLRILLRLQGMPSR